MDFDKQSHGSIGNLDQNDQPLGSNVDLDDDVHSQQPQR
jgi:hypothetical protein